jgi:hypothetical protein
VLATGCGGGDDEGSEANGATDSGENGNQPDDTGSPSEDSTVIGSPTISGKPLPQALPDMQYVFTPSASDADSDSLTFSAENVPSWATFNAANGRLSGIPIEADIGSYQAITITVSDGERTVSLPPFSIDVVAFGSGSATLSWAAPTMRTDGTPLADLAGYRIYWGTSAGKYTRSVTIGNPAVMTYVVEGLVPATYYFVATAFDSTGDESRYSNVALKIVN